MKGTDQYNNEFDSYSKGIIQRNLDKQYLKGFYYFLLSDGKRSYSGAYNYLNRVLGFVNHYNIIDPRTIEFDHYTEYLSCAYTGKSSSHQITTYSALKSFSKYLKAKGLCEEDYMSYIRRPKFSETDKTKNKRECGYMNEEEVKLFISNIKHAQKQACWKARDYAIIMVLLNSGIRCAALQKLDIDDFDFHNNTISVLEKGNKARIITLSRETMDAVKEWIFYRSKLKLSDEECAMFVSNHNRRMNRKTIYNMIKEYGCVIDGKNITPHKTRATYGTQIYNKTHDIYFVQECMGHSSPTVTEKYIRGQKANVSKKASELMSDFLS